MDGVSSYSVFRSTARTASSSTSAAPSPTDAAARPHRQPPAPTIAVPPPLSPRSRRPVAHARRRCRRSSRSVPRDAHAAGCRSRRCSRPTPAPPQRRCRPAAPAANSNGKFSLARQLGLGVSRIVIDAGHGGHDPGAHGNGINEAELTLDVALRLQKLLEKQPGIEVVMTRDTDVFIPLEERTAIANREGADLFLSIHANASRNAQARGIETYFLNFASNPEAEAVAARENAASAQADAQPARTSSRRSRSTTRSTSRATSPTTVQKSMAQAARRAQQARCRDLGVKQAPFVVLIGAAMPSVLAEISFVTNKQEGALLKTHGLPPADRAGALRRRRRLPAGPETAERDRREEGDVLRVGGLQSTVCSHALTAGLSRRCAESRAGSRRLRQRRYHPWRGAACSQSTTHPAANQTAGRRSAGFPPAPATPGRRRTRSRRGPYRSPAACQDTAAGGRGPSPCCATSRKRLAAARSGKSHAEPLWY